MGTWEVRGEIRFLDKPASELPGRTNDACSSTRTYVFATGFDMEELE